MSPCLAGGVPAQLLRASRQAGAGANALVAAAVVGDRPKSSQARQARVQVDCDSGQSKKEEEYTEENAAEPAWSAASATPAPGLENSFKT